MIRCGLAACWTLGPGTNSTTVSQASALLVQDLQPLFVLRSGEPDTFVGQDLVRSKAHGWDDVRHVGEKRMSEDRHEPNLTVGQLKHVP